MFYPFNLTILFNYIINAGGYKGEHKGGHKGDIN